MPRQVSPEEALNRSRDMPDDDTPRESIAVRVPVRLWREIARFGMAKKTKDMSTAYRGVLEEWANTKALGEKVGLEAIPSGEMEAVLRGRGKIVLGRRELLSVLRKWITRIRLRVLKALDRHLGELGIEDVATKIAQDLLGCAAEDPRPERNRKKGAR